MLFPSVQFAIFFPIVLTISWALMSRQQYWKPFILVASYIFYACASPVYCLLLAGVTLWNHLASVWMHRVGHHSNAAKWICRGAVTGDLLCLGFFDYYTFFAQSISKVFHDLSLGGALPLVTVALPVGISFYTFQAISYTVDVKRGLIEPANLLDAAVYLSFFPHLVAGPIVRAREFLPQLRQPRDPNKVAVSSGITLIAVGLVKKVVLADYLGRTVVDPVFAVPQGYKGPDILISMYGYAAQIYCDFSGYTDMAIGLALLLGFVFPQNFNAPYRATGFQDFWRRWHMTLSRFLRDFLYIPLGGNRGKRKWFTYRNLIITMVLGGLWHGAAWTFVIWGAFHGIAMAIERALKGRFKFPGWLRWFVTFNLVCLAWVPFRAQSLSATWQFLERLGHWGSPTLLSVPVVLAIAAALVPQWLPAEPIQKLQIWFGKVNPYILAPALSILILFVAATVPSQGVPPFIYFRF